MSAVLGFKPLSEVVRSDQLGVKGGELPKGFSGELTAPSWKFDCCIPNCFHCIRSYRHLNRLAPTLHNHMNPSLKKAA